MADTKKSEGKLGSILGGAVKLDWVRPLLWKVGGRKMVMGGGGMGIIKLIVGDGNDLSWPKAVACVAVAIVAVGGMFSVGLEDAGRGKHEEGEGK